MTNEVENLIIDNKTSELTYSEKVSYKIYKEIWKYILYSRQYNPNIYEIDFQCNYTDNSYCIYKSDGIKFIIKELNNTDTLYQNRTYHRGTTIFDIDNILNTSFDFRLLCKLLEQDNFHVSYLDDMNPILVHIEIDKYKVDNIINGIYLKNKVLRKENKND